MGQQCRGKTWRWTAVWSCIVVAVAAMNLPAASWRHFVLSHDPQPALHTASVPGSIYQTNIRLQKFSQATREDNSQSHGIEFVYGAIVGAQNFSHEPYRIHAACSVDFYAAILRNRAPPFRQTSIIVV